MTVMDRLLDPLCAGLAAAGDHHADRTGHGGHHGARAAAGAAPAFWALACLLIAAGFALIAERGQIPDLLSILIANLMFIAGYAALLAGFSRLAGQAEGTAWGLGIAFCGFFTAAYLAGAEIEPRIVLGVVLAVALFSALAADRVFGAAEQVAPFLPRVSWAGCLWSTCCLRWGGWQWRRGYRTCRPSCAPC